jgi:hypothetical protein
MKTLLVIFLLCNASVQAQQMIIVQDSILLGILDTFIDDLKLEEKEYKMIRIELDSFQKQERVVSMDTVSIGSMKGWKMETAPDINYSIQITYEVSPLVINSYPPAYYCFHRGIPVIVNTGFENFIKADKKAMDKLKRRIRKYTSWHLVGAPIMWIVDVHNKDVKFNRVSNSE